MPYSSQRYEVLFDILNGDMTAIEGAGHERVSRYRATTWFCKDLMDAAIYPLWSYREDVQKAAAMTRYETTREAQKKLNGRNALKQAKRLIHNNFGLNDLFLTLTCIDEPDLDELHRRFYNFMRQVNRYRKNHGLPKQKYMCFPGIAPEGSKKKVRIHLHVFMTGGGIGYRDVVEGMWKYGIQTNTKRLQPDENGLEAIVTYVLKDPDVENAVRDAEGHPRWWGSRNLKRPQPRVADKKIEKYRDIEPLLNKDNDAQLKIAAEEIFERRYPGWKLTDCEVKRSPFVPGAYIYVQMHRARGGG